MVKHTMSDYMLNDNDMICQVHNKKMTEGKYGWYCKTPVVKNPDGSVEKWCDYKVPTDSTPSKQSKPSTAQPRASQGQPDWDAIGQAKAATLLWAAILPKCIENTTLDWNDVRGFVDSALAHIQDIQEGKNKPPF